MKHTNNLEPIYGGLLSTDNEVLNIVDLLGGGEPLKGITRKSSNYEPQTAVVIGSDDQCYDLTKLLGSKNQYAEMPEPSEELNGRIVMYTGETTDAFTHAHFYECVSSGGESQWLEIRFSSGTGGGGLSASVVGDTLVIE